jgi:uncharacterized protein (TIGR03437 family)
MRNFLSAKHLALFSFLILLSIAGHDSQANSFQTTALASDPVRTETTKLFDSAPKRVPSFGSAVAVSGDTIAVGAKYDTTSPDGESDGSVSVYTRNGGTWSLQQKLYFVNNHINDNFGCDVALSGDTLVAGVRAAPVNPESTFSSENEGAAAIYVRSNGRWTLQQVLRPNDLQKEDYFGSYVAISGDTVAITNSARDFNRSVYLFTRSGSTWTQQQKVPGVFRAALSSDTLAVTLFGNFSENYVKIYTRTGATWTPRQELQGDPSNTEIGFASSVAVSENHIAVGASGEQVNPGGVEEGVVYIFGRSGAGWVRRQKITANNVSSHDHVGSSVAISGNTLVVGTNYAPASPRTTAGAAYVFTYNGTEWVQQQQLGPSDGAKDDRFGQAVAISGENFVVGAHFNGQVRAPGQIPYIPGAAYAYSPPAVPARPVSNVSAASYQSSTLAPESIVSAFGTGLAMSTQLATGALPTALAGTTVKVKDSAGVERMSPLFFVSPSQINYQIPAGTTNGAATVTVRSGDGSVSAATVQINRVAPGVFTADASGRGLAAAVVLRVKADGALSYEPISRYDAAQSKLVPIPIDLGAETDQVFLLLFGTGARHRTSLSNVTAKLGGVDGQVSFAGAQESFAGLDQLNIRLSRQLIGRGEIEALISVDGQTANPVKLWIK